MLSFRLINFVFCLDFICEVICWKAAPIFLKYQVFPKIGHDFWKCPIRKFFNILWFCYYIFLYSILIFDFSSTLNSFWKNFCFCENWVFCSIKLKILQYHSRLIGRIKFTCNYFHLYSKSTNIVNFSVIFGQNVALNSMNYLYTYFMLEYHFNGHKSNW